MSNARRIVMAAVGSGLLLGGIAAADPRPADPAAQARFERRQCVGDAAASCHLDRAGAASTIALCLAPRVDRCESLYRARRDHLAAQLAAR